MEKPKTVEQLKQHIERKNSHFDFQFTEDEYDYFMKNARLKPIEKEVLQLRRKDISIVTIAFELGMSESNVNKIIAKIKRKIIKCIIFG